MLKLARSIRTKYYLAKITTGNSLEYEKQIYKKNLNWNPPPAPLIIEDKITEFEKAIKSFQKKKNIRQIQQSKITKPQPLPAENITATT